MKDYILRIVMAAIVCAIAGGLLNEKTTAGKLARLLCGIFLTITVFSPFANVRFQNITDYFDDISVEAQSYVEDGTTAAENSINGIIKRQTEAYILDKANLMGLEITVEVELDEEENSVPCGVKLTGNASPYAKQVLGAYIAENLGVAKENQRWI